MKLKVMIRFASTNVPAVLFLLWTPAFAPITLPAVTVEKEAPPVARPAAPKKAARPAVSVRRVARAAAPRVVSRSRASRAVNAPAEPNEALAPLSSPAKESVSVAPFGGPGLAASKTPADVVTVSGAELDRFRAQR